MILAHAAAAAGSWSPDPSALASLTVAAAAYALGFARRRRPRDRRLGAGQGLAFAAAVVTLTVALASPLDALSSALFSVHMVQHLLLVIVAAPLLVAARPGTALLAAVSPRWRRAGHRLGAAAPVRAAVPWLTHPISAWTFYAVVLWGWHLPSLYELAVRSEVVHVLEHVTLLAVAALTWWLVVTRRGRFAIGRLPAVLLVFAVGLQGSALGAVLALASTPLYGVHAAGAAAFGLSPLEDQQLAGMLMWVPPGVVYLTAMVVLLFRWFAELEVEAPRTAPAAAPEHSR